MRSLRQRGFSMLEIVLALTILSFMFIFASRSMTNALRTRKKVQTEVSDVSSLRDAMKVIRGDIHQIYNHFDYEKELLNQISKSRQQNAAAGPNAGIGGVQNPQAPPPQPPLVPTQRENKREDPRTQFLGGEDKVHFVTMNQARFMAGEQQADFIEVGYSMRTCESYREKGKSSNCLFRRVQSILDNDIEKGGTETAILENVKEFSLRYLVEGREDWVKEWRSTIDASNPTAPKTFIPDAIEVNLGIETQFEGKPRVYSLQYVVPIHFPNNVKDTAPSSSFQSPGVTQ
jgi:prepilin-type N-terminal cleavage/methylation domain-containing protein